MLRNWILRFPLPEGWSEPEVHFDVFEKSDLRTLQLGLVSRHSDGRMATASAVDLSDAVWPRAYFELLERTLLMDYVLSHPVPQGENWKLSLSNGVAIHPDETEARSRAAWEALERDAVLRSWYSGRKPEELKLTESEKLESHYEWRTALFETRSIKGEAGAPFTVGVFGFPKTSEAPLAIGFGCRPILEQAIQHARLEAYQRLSFLWGEEISEDGEIPPGPEAHLTRFSLGSGIRSLRDWLDGKLASSRSHHPSSPVTMTYENLTPQSHRAKVRIIRASSPELIPLVFGSGCPALRSRVGEIFPDREIHPIS